ncbi:MAG: hypothetical protein ABJN34_06760 [Litoreibacter sp.]|uniref:hypothetical protein n=1 Tax=Litoreibacter sp. TaxID=1969459 RepID=UPI003299DF6D
MQSNAKKVSATDGVATNTPSASQVTKARMLVSLLGADFAKTSTHPFFKELAHTAVKSVDVEPTTPDISQALAKLVRRLAEAKKAKPRRSVPASAGVEASSDESLAQRNKPEIMVQHPALIAKHLIALPTDQQLEALRKLRGQTARQVATYVAELKK